jgi:hypothetical protein
MVETIEMTDGGDSVKVLLMKEGLIIDLLHDQRTRAYERDSILA